MNQRNPAAPSGIAPEKPFHASSDMLLVTFNNVSLWCSWHEEEDCVVFDAVWINGEWIEPIDLFGLAQHDAWAVAVEADAYAHLADMAAEDKLSLWLEAREAA